MTKKTQIVAVQTTVSSEKDAFDLAGKVVASCAGACAQYFPIKSVYRWKGKTENAKEFMLVCKTPAGKAKKLVEFIKKNHKYALPEIIVLEINGGYGPYLKWVEKETR